MWLRRHHSPARAAHSSIFRPKTLLGLELPRPRAPAAPPAPPAASLGTDQCQSVMLRLPLPLHFASRSLTPPSAPDTGDMPLSLCSCFSFTSAIVSWNPTPGPLGAAIYRVSPSWLERRGDRVILKARHHHALLRPTHTALNPQRQRPTPWSVVSTSRRRRTSPLASRMSSSGRWSTSTPSSSGSAIRSSRSRSRRPSARHGRTTGGRLAGPSSSPRHSSWRGMILLW
jgi:hypothetical protein